MEICAPVQLSHDLELVDVRAAAATSAKDATPCKARSVFNQNKRNWRS